MSNSEQHAIATTIAKRIGEDFGIVPVNEFHRGATEQELIDCIIDAWDEHVAPYRADDDRADAADQLVTATIEES